MLLRRKERHSTFGERGTNKRVIGDKGEWREYLIVEGKVRLGKSLKRIKSKGILSRDSGGENRSNQKWVKMG